MASSKTPVMQQHAEAKAAHPDAILFFRLGDFYEMFFEDAVAASRALDKEAMLVAIERRVLVECAQPLRHLPLQEPVRPAEVTKTDLLGIHRAKGE